MKKLLIISLIMMFSVPVYAETKLEDLNELNIRPPAYRVGLTDAPEKKYVEIEAKSIVEETKAKVDIDQMDIGELTYADLSIKKMSKEISKELELEEEDMMGDLSLLWQGAAAKSDTISFALYKLSNPEEDKPNDKSVKKVLLNIASMSTLVGAGTGNPMVAMGSMLGSNIFGIMSQDTKALNYKYTKVTDSDMIILIRKIEDLQQKTVNLYYDYMTAKKLLDLYGKVVDQRKKNYNAAQELSREIILITDAYYRTALDDQTKARSNFYARRAALEQFVGNDVFTQFEKGLIERDKKKN